MYPRFRIANRIEGLCQNWGINQAKFKMGFRNECCIWGILCRSVHLWFLESRVHFYENNIANCYIL